MAVNAVGAHVERGAAGGPPGPAYDCHHSLGVVLAETLHSTCAHLALIDAGRYTKPNPALRTAQGAPPVAAQSGSWRAGVQYPPRATMVVYRIAGRSTRPRANLTPASARSRTVSCHAVPTQLRKATAGRCICVARSRPDLGIDAPPTVARRAPCSSLAKTKLDRTR